MPVDKDEPVVLGALQALKDASEREETRIRLNALERRVDLLDKDISTNKEAHASCRSSCNTGLWSAAGIVVTLCLAFFGATFYVLNNNIDSVEKRLDVNFSSRIDRLSDKVSDLKDRVDKFER